MDENCGYNVEDVHGGTQLDEIMCETCGTTQPATNRVCEHCGGDLKVEKVKAKASQGGNGKKILVLLCIILVIVGIIIAFAVMRTKEKCLYPAGDYVVGEDIPAGEYLLISDFYGRETEDIQAYVESGDFYCFFHNSFYIRLEEGDCIETVLCSFYSPDGGVADNNPLEHSGMFKVGRDVEAGTYKVIPDGTGCFPWYRTFEDCRDFEPDTFLNGSSPLDEEYPDTYIQLKDGDYVSLLYCYLEEAEDMENVSDN